MYQEKAKRADDEFDEGAKSIYNAIAKFYERILKDTNRQINIHRDFFENFSDITSVNIIGHSMLIYHISNQYSYIVPIK